MKRVLLTIALVASFGSLSAQLPGNKTLDDAYNVYIQALEDQKIAIENVRKEERVTIEAAKANLDVARKEYNEIKAESKVTIKEHKRIIKNAQKEMKEAKMQFKQQSARAKQEIASAKSNTKAVIESHKSAVAKAKAEISRLKVEKEDSDIKVAVYSL